MRQHTKPNPYYKGTLADIKYTLEIFDIGKFELYEERNPLSREIKLTMSIEDFHFWQIFRRSRAKYAFSLIKKYLPVHVENVTLVLIFE